MSEPIDFAELQEAFDDGCRASECLTKVLGPIYERWPDLFPRPLAEMGVSDKMSTAKTLLEFHGEVSEREHA